MSIKKKCILVLIASSFLLVNSSYAFKLFSKNNSDYSQTKYSLRSGNLSPKVYNLAITAYKTALKKGVRVSKNVITIIDYSIDATEPRLFVVDLARNKMLFQSLVAHGQGTGGIKATYFSDKPGTLTSSLGLFLTEDTYVGKRGYSLNLKGLETGFNKNAKSRRIVMHPAWYVSKDMAKQYGRLGRSWGCPAVESHIAKPIIDTIKNGSLLFSYYPDRNYLQRSEFLNS